MQRDVRGVERCICGGKLLRIHSVVARRGVYASPASASRSGGSTGAAAPVHRAGEEYSPRRFGLPDLADGEGGGLGVLHAPCPAGPSARQSDRVAEPFGSFHPSGGSGG